MVLPLWVLLFVCGICAALTFEGAAPLWLVAAVVAASGVAALSRRAVVVAGAALAIAAGTAHGLWAMRTAVQPPPALADGKTAVRVEAVVERGPVALSDGRVRVWATTDRIGESPARQRVQLSLRTGREGESGAVSPGDRLVVVTPLSPPRGLANFGMPDAALAVRARGVDLQAATSWDRVVVVSRGRWWSPRRIAQRLHDALGDALDRGALFGAASFLRGVVLGDRTAVDANTEAGFRAAGATHVLSVSGLHLSAVSGVVFFLLRALLLRSSWLALRFDPALGAAALSLPLVVLYTMVTGEAVATERAAVMAATLLGAIFVRRTPSFASAVAAAALVLLSAAPLSLLDVSFQLSFASVISLALWARTRPGPAGDKPNHARRALRWVGSALLASAAAAIATAPLCAHHFAEISPASPIGNLVLIPLVELVVVPAGLAGAVLGMIHPWLAMPPLALASLGSRAALVVADFFRATAPILPIRSPNAAETAALSVAVVCALSVPLTSAALRRRLMVTAAIVGAVGFASLFLRPAVRLWSSDVVVTFLDVGQGDAALIEGPKGFVALVDGGGSVDGTFDPGARVIEPILRRKGISRLDLVVLTHPHPDHMNGLLRVVDRFEVAALWQSGDDGRNPVYADMMARARRRGVPTPTPVAFDREGLHVEPLGPFVGDRIGAPSGLSTNDASLTLRMSYGGRSLLFAGDLEEDGETELLGRAARGLVVKSDVLKVPHHGSRTSSTPEFLAAVAPSLAVASLGHLNRFGFPHAEVVRRLEQRAVRFLRTDEVGSVRLTIARDGGLQATCARGCR